MKKIEFVITTLLAAIIITGCGNVEQKGTGYYTLQIVDGNDAFNFNKKMKDIIVDDGVETRVRGFDTEELQQDIKIHDETKYVYDNMKKYIYESDMSQYGKSDQYAVLSDKRRRGDCEDQAFKMIDLLIEAGIKFENIDLIFGRLYDQDMNYVGGHAWVNYYVDGKTEPITLTNNGYIVERDFADKYWKEITIISFVETIKRQKEKTW